MPRRRSGHLRVLLVGLLALLLSGCFVLDELDEGQRLMDQHAGKGVKKEEEAAAAEPTAPAGGSGGAKAFDPSRWWKSARSLGPEKKDKSIVRCELPGGSQFMREPDCLMRGGRPAS